MPEKVVVFDVETGGTNPAVHPITQFAAIAVNEQWEEVASVNFLLRFNEADCSPEALEIQGYDRERWEREAVDPLIIRKQVASFFRQHATLQETSKAGRPYLVARVCGHNASTFDRYFLERLFAFEDRERGIDRVFLPAATYRALDTLSLARWVSLARPPGPKDHKLGSLVEWLGLPAFDAHDALADVRATAAVARGLLARMKDGAS